MNNDHPKGYSGNLWQAFKRWWYVERPWILSRRKRFALLDEAAGEWMVRMLIETPDGLREETDDEFLARILARLPL